MELIKYFTVQIINSWQDFYFKTLAYRVKEIKMFQCELQVYKTTLGHRAPAHHTPDPLGLYHAPDPHASPKQFILFMKLYP